MSASFDLDIKNYSIVDLISFFKLEPTYTSGDLDNKEKEMSITILNTNQNNETKYNLLNFIKTAKEILTNNLNPESIKDKKDKPIILQNKPEESQSGKANNVGKIINPISNRPSLQTQSIPFNSVNGYGYNTFIVNYVFNTTFRDNFFNSQSTNCTFTLPTKMRNVISLSLSGLQFPNVMFTFSAVKGTNQIFIRENSPEGPPVNGPFEAIVTIPEGNYTDQTFPDVLKKEINEQVLGIIDPTNWRFDVSLNINTRYITIENKTYDFDINTITNDYGIFYECETNFTTNFKIGSEDPKQKITPETYTYTLGYQMGFRQIRYSGKLKYITESHFDPTYSDYVYFSLNDYTGSQTSNVYGILPNSLLDKNVLAVIPLTTPQFSNTFDNNANFIYKTRNYLGPVDISKITIGLLNPLGGQLDLHFTDFAFTLQVQSIYDNNIPYQNNTVSII
jgi:hypothetical protein